MGPDGCRETRRTETRETAHKPRQDFSIQKVKFFSLLVAKYEVTSREKSGPFLFHSKWDKWQVLYEKKIGKRKSFF